MSAVEFAPFSPDESGVWGSFEAPTSGSADPGDPPDAVQPAQRLRIERETHKLEKRLCREVGRAIVDYNMIEAGDRVMVCMSGGKDSYAMLDILQKLQARAPVRFELIAVKLDQKQPDFPEHVLPEYLAATGVPFHIENQDTYSIVADKIAPGKTMCSLCSRLRRGILYRVADELGATKIALGHHRDDILQTFFLNLFFAGRLKAMPPKLVSDDGRHIVIRPLANVAEKDLIRWAAHRQFPIIPCNLCGSQENLQRKHVGAMLTNWDREHPGRSANIYNALQHVVPSHLLDASRFDFAGLVATGAVDPESVPDCSAIGQADAAMIQSTANSLERSSGSLLTALRLPIMLSSQSG